MWFVLLCCSVVMGLINPYVHLFSVVSLAQLVVTGCFGVIIYKNVRQLKKELSSKRLASLKETMKKYLFYFCIVTTTANGLSTVITLAIYMLLSGQLDGKATEIGLDLLGLKGNIYECNLILVIQMMCSSFSMLLAISKACELLAMCRDTK